MIGTRYHLTENGPRTCVANLRDCPVGGAHFPTKEEADTAYEFKVKQNHSAFNIFKKKPKDPHTKHVFEADRIIKEMEADLALRDQRQTDGALIHQLVSEGFTPELLEERFNQETRTREATIGYGKVDENETAIVGIVYGGDYKSEEEVGQSEITKGLANGLYEKDDVLFYEKDGVYVFAVKGERAYGFGDGSELDPVVRNEETAIERYHNQSIPGQFERKWQLQQKSLEDLKAEFKDTIKPLPRSKEKLIAAVLEREIPVDYRKTAVGEFQNGRALVIVTEDPLEAKLMSKLKEAHDGGHLRLGGSANPFGRGSLFYDDRDVSREKKMAQVRTDQAYKYAKAYVAETRAKISKMNGSVFAVSPRVDANVQDVRDVKYWLNWAPSGRPQIMGLYSKEDMDKMAEGDFSMVQK